MSMFDDTTPRQGDDERTLLAKILQANAAGGGGDATAANQESELEQLYLIVNSVGSIDVNLARDGQKTMATSIPVVLPSDQSTIVVGGTTPRLTGTFSRPADNTAYGDGDIIANSGTAGSVIPITFTLTRPSGRISGVRCVVTPASGNLVIANLSFDLILFRPESSIPFAAGGYPADNAALAITAAAYAEAVAVFAFTATQWRSPAGSKTVAGVTGYQSVALDSSRPYAPFNVTGLSSALLGLVQARGAWTPTGIVNAFNFALDVDLD